MAKFSGKIGFVSFIEADPINDPGVYTESIEERHYYGDFLRMGKRWDNGEGLNDNLRINHNISIVADPYIKSNLASVRYVECFGAKWKVTNAESEYPRITLTLGGIWHG